MSLASRIDSLLPQTQCQRCGYPACRPYAEAIVKGDADINKCPPGGEAGIRRLAGLLGRKYLPLSPANGAETPKQVVVIDESTCIGCTLCIQACPVDAIVGASKQMHTVIAELCTGCELCIPPCPVDCIEVVRVARPQTEHANDDYAMTAEEKAAADAARTRYEFRQFRLARAERERAQRMAALSAAERAERHGNTGKKQDLVAAALERAKAIQAAKAAGKSP